jgi:hypothetical protein
LLAAVALAAFPASASAAIARVDEFDPDYGACKADCPDPTFEVVFLANRGERNDVTATRDPGGAVVLHDAGAPITPKDGCAAIDANTARCGDGHATLRVTARDRGDAVTIVDGYAIVEGGAGNDRLRGGPEADTLVGGPGNDELHGGGGDDQLLDGVRRISGANDDSFDGGEGRDAVDYSGRLVHVGIDLRSPAGAGQAREHDTLTAIENATGGSAGDTIAGDDGRNHLDGGAGGGADVVRGGGGDDLIGAGPGDKAYGGSGQDLFGPSDEATGGTLERIDCGADPDVVGSAGIGTVVGDSCEVVTGPGTDLFRHHLPLGSFDDPVLTYEQRSDNPGGYWAPDSERIEIRASGVAAHKRHPRPRTLLAVGESGNAEKFDLRLTPEGIALLRRYGRIRARVLFRHDGMGYLIDLRAPPSGSA